MISIIQISHSDWLPSGNPELKINLKTIIDESWTSLPLWEHLWKYLIGSKMTSLKLQRKSCLEISQVELLLHRTTVHFLAQYRPLWPGTRFKKERLLYHFAGQSTFHQKVVHFYQRAFIFRRIIHLALHFRDRPISQLWAAHFHVDPFWTNVSLKTPNF